MCEQCYGTLGPASSTNVECRSDESVHGETKEFSDLGNTLENGGDHMQMTKCVMNFSWRYHP